MLFIVGFIASFFCIYVACGWSLGMADNDNSPIQSRIIVILGTCGAIFQTMYIVLHLVGAAQ